MTGMTRTLLSVKEIFQELGVSVQSIRRVYLRREIPSYRISTMLRFNLDHAQRILPAKGVNARTTTRRATGGAAADAHSSIAPVR